MLCGIEWEGIMGDVTTLPKLCSYNPSSQQIYGLTTTLTYPIVRKGVLPIVITAGSGAWGTEHQIHDGTVIESGNAGMNFDLNRIYISAVGTANRVTYLEFYKNTLATAKTGIVITDATDTFTLIGHGYSDGDKIMLSSIVTTTGLTTYIVYHVVGVAGNDFKVSLTAGGAAVVVGGGNGTCSARKVTQTLVSECLATRNATTADPIAQDIQTNHLSCDSIISCRGYAVAGTNAVSFFLGLHTYAL